MFLGTGALFVLYLLFWPVIKNLVHRYGSSQVSLQGRKKTRKKGKGGDYNPLPGPSPHDPDTNSLKIQTTVIITRNETGTEQIGFRTTTPLI